MHLWLYLEPISCVCVNCVCAYWPACAPPLHCSLLLGHTQGKPTTRTETSKLSGKPCCINERDGRTWQPKHVDHRALEGLQRLDWLIIWQGANPIWQDMAPALRVGGRRPHVPMNSLVCVCVDMFFMCMSPFLCVCVCMCLPACDNSPVLFHAWVEATHAEGLVWKFKCQIDHTLKRAACAYQTLLNPDQVKPACFSQANYGLPRSRENSAITLFPHWHEVTDIKRYCLCLLCNS